MKIKKYLAAGMVCCMILLLFAGCGRKKPEIPVKIQAGIIVYNQSDVFLGELVTCLRQQFEERRS